MSDATETSSVVIERLELTNLLSFGPDSPGIELGPLNVLIGPNGSGKSNFIHAIGLLRSLPKSSALGLDGMEPSELLWRRQVVDPANIEATASFRLGATFDYAFSASLAHSKLHFSLESLMQVAPDGERSSVFERSGNDVDFGSTQWHGGLPGSVLSQNIGDRPEIVRVASFLGRIAIYRNWSFGSQAPLRVPQTTQLFSDTLQDDAENLGLVLNRLNQDTASKERLITGLQRLYEGVNDLRVNISAGKVMLDVTEGDNRIPASHLSDGTLRYLCLLAILNDPDPPPLICLEEPELGLHPDILPTVGELLMDASTRCQLIVTTHSDVLVDKLTYTPESVVICEKHEGQTHMQRLDKAEISEWLKLYSESLGELWSRGHLGGNRW